MSFYHIPIFTRFQWLNHPGVVRLLASFLKLSSRGRKGYNKVLLLRWLMYKQLVRCSYRDLESITHIDYSTFIKFRKRLISQNWFLQTFEHVTLILTPKKSSLLIIDSSFVETYSQCHEKGSAYSGHKEKIGFKLHTIIDYVSRLPVFQSITHGAVADVRAGAALIRGAPPDIPVTAFLADKGYDSASFVDLIHTHWKKETRVAIPVRHTGGNIKNHLLKYAERSRNKTLYKKRTAIERYFSRKKGVFHLGEERTRGLKNFEVNCYMTSIMEYLEWG